MKSAQDIIIRPLITEKSTGDAAIGKYTFIVAPDATKPDIARACEKLFAVKVLKVNTISRSGKQKRVGAHPGRTSDFKKAVVTIDTDPKADTFLTKGGRTSSSTRKYKNVIEEFGFGQ